MTQEEIRKLLKTYELHINQAEDDELLFVTCPKLSIKSSLIPPVL